MKWREENRQSWEDWAEEIGGFLWVVFWFLLAMAYVVSFH